MSAVRLRRSGRFGERRRRRGGLAADAEDVRLHLGVGRAPGRESNPIPSFFLGSHTRQFRAHAPASHPHRGRPASGRAIGRRPPTSCATPRRHPPGHETTVDIPDRSPHAGFLEQLVVAHRAAVPGRGFGGSQGTARGDRRLDRRRDRSHHPYGDLEHRERPWYRVLDL
jgi:hypothetical protein